MTKAFEWLKDTPCGDCIFIGALKRASVEEIEMAIAFREPLPGNKTAVKVLRAELRRRAKTSGAEQAKNPEGAKEAQQ